MKLQMAAIAIVSAMLGGVFGVAVWRVAGEREVQGASAPARDIRERIASLELEMSRFRDPPPDDSNAVPEKGALPGVNSRWMCAQDGHCSPVDYEMNELVRKDPPVARAWAARSSFFAAKTCNTHAKAHSSDCVETSFVVCSTHDVGDMNVCFRTWRACLDNERTLRRENPRECRAYFAGRVLD